MKTRVYLLLIFLIGLAFSSCKENEQLIEPQNNSTLLLKISTQSIPESVHFLVGTLSRDGYETIQKDFLVTNSLSEIEFENIPSGIWHFQLRAFNESEEVLYAGESDVEILPNLVNQLNITMSPVSGSLQIAITWDTNPNQKILFYGFENQSISLIGTVNLDGSNLKELYRGNKLYPTWYNYPNSILTIDRGNGYRISKSIIDNNSISSEFISDDLGNKLYISYSKNVNSIVYSYKDDLDRIGVYNLTGKTMKNFDGIPYKIANPSFTPSGEWIYFNLFENNTSNIYKIDINGNNLTKVIIDQNFSLLTPAVNKSERLLVCCRYNDSESYLSVYDIETKELVYNIDVAEHYCGLYPSFTNDSKKILFTNGIPSNYSVARNIYIMNIDGTNKKQLTFYSDLTLARPLNW